MANAYTLGDVLPFGIQIYDGTGVLANATTVTLSVLQPDGTLSGPFTVTPTSVGVYSYLFTTTQAGRHLGEWTANGTNAGGEPQAFVVLPVAPLMTVSEFKAHTSMVGTADDSEVAAFIASAIAVLEGMAGPIYPRVIVSETHDGGTPNIWTDFAPVISVSTLTEMYGYTQFTLTAQTIGGASDNYGYTVDDYREGRITRRGVAHVAYPFGLIQSASQMTGRGTVIVSYTAGRANPSANIQFALKELVRYFWQQVKGGPSSFADGFSAAASTGLSAAMRDRILLILGPEAVRPLGIA